MLIRRLVRRLLLFAFRLFYNQFAFTYDFVSALVSHGRWRAWTRLAIPRIQGTRVLEVPCGTGNLLLDLYAAGFAPVGLDLSPWMLRITRGKLRRSQIDAPLARARAQAMPFPGGTFDSVVMTFPPGFIYDPAALVEIKRVLNNEGRLIWVDSARFVQPSLWARLVNRWIGFVGGETEYENLMRRVLADAGLDARIEWVSDDVSVVLVATATKRRGP